MSQRNRSVLIHGAGHDAGLWAPVAGPLRIAGREVLAPGVAGHDRSDTVERRNVRYPDAVKSVVEYIVEADPRDFILPGNSVGSHESMFSDLAGPARKIHDAGRH